MQCCHTGQGAGLGGEQGSRSSGRVHVASTSGQGGTALTFDLSADLGEVRHPLEDFGVRCLVSVRGLW